MNEITKLLTPSSVSWTPTGRDVRALSATDVAAALARTQITATSHYIRLKYCDDKSARRPLRNELVAWIRKAPAVRRWRGREGLMIEIIDVAIDEALADDRYSDAARARRVKMHYSNWRARWRARYEQYIVPKFATMESDFAAAVVRELHSDREN